MDRLGTIAIVGVGLIGGSIGLATRARGVAFRRIGVGRDRSRLEEARRLGAIDEATTDPSDAAREADVIVVCTPVSRVAADCLAMAACAPEHALITDAGSTKAAIVGGVEADAAASHRFCGAHPIAGSERQGAAHARGDLFEGRTCVLTPGDRTTAQSLAAARRFWQSLGCRVIEMSPADHDAALAMTSHLPHVLASAQAAIVPEALHAVAAGAFRDVTRVASADPGLWADIFLANRGPTLAALDALDDRLGEFRALLREGNPEALAAWWGEGKTLRDRFARSFRADAAKAPLPGDS